MNKGIREKLYRMGKTGRRATYLEVDLFADNDNGTHRYSRIKTGNATSEIQKKLNDKRMMKNLLRLWKNNFGEDDYCVTLTYNDRCLPATGEDAMKDFKRYVAAVNKARHQMGLPNVKYSGRMEYGGEKGRLHFHFLMSGGLPPKMMKLLWCQKRRRGSAYKSLGLADISLFQPEEGYERWLWYICKDIHDELNRPYGQMQLSDFLKDQKISVEETLGEAAKHKRHWINSRGLVKPDVSINDRRWTKRQINKLIEKCRCRQKGSIDEDIRHVFEHKYKGYVLDEYNPVFNIYTGQWSIYLKLHVRS